MQRSATADQIEHGQKFVCAMPALINSDKVDEYKSLGPILDLIQQFSDHFITDHGCKLFSNSTRDEKLTSKFRSATGAQICRAEAATVTRQMLGSLKDVESGKLNFASTKRHR